MKIIMLAVIPAIFIFSSPVTMAFNPFSGACKQAPSSPTCQQSAAQGNSPTNPAIKIIRAAADIIATLGGIAAVIVIIISGFQFVTAGGVSPGQRSGDTNRIKSARASIAGALVGLVIIALAWTLVTFVTDHFAG